MLHIQQRSIAGIHHDSTVICERTPCFLGELLARSTVNVGNFFVSCKYPSGKAQLTQAPVFQINTNFALAGRNDAQKADAQIPYQALRLQNARRTVRETRPVRARQNGERSGGDGEKGKRIRGIVIIQYLIIEDRRNSSCLSSYNLIKVYKHTTSWLSPTHPLLMLFFSHIIDSCKYPPNHNSALFFL